MFEFKTPVLNNAHETPPARNSQRTYQRNQQRLMGTALALLLGTLVFVLYRDRDFWFPDSQDAEDQPQQSVAAAATVPVAGRPATREMNKSHTRAVTEKRAEVLPPSGATITATRTVLPPLEVEVVAGSVNRNLHPGSNSIQVDLERGSPPVIPAKPAPVEPTENAAQLTSNAADRVQVSADTANVVTHSVRPAYPTLARQMQVQGSVVLQALIGRNGAIEDLQVLSGPPILANAAKEAVRQWQFKPHYDGSRPVETQAKITVNFTISTH